MSSSIDVAIIGAGPYGLSVASHLRAQSIEFRLFGFPMQTWCESMPARMKLKSEGFASSISDPSREFTLEKYCAINGIPYADTGLPVEVGTFSRYGEAFQRKFVPDLERRTVASVEPAQQGFEVRLDDGEAVTARRVIVASGIRSFDYIPPELQGFPRELVTHSADYGDASHLARRDVVIVGAGSSATDIAALLRAQGAKPTLLTRRSVVRFQTPLGQRSLYDELTAPMTGLGPGWKSVLCVKAPLLFHAMPEAFRVDVVRRYLGPAPAWFVREEVEGRVPFITQSTLLKAEAEGTGLKLRIRQNGSVREISAQHVIAATGYRVDVDRLGFLGKRIRSDLRRTGSAPALTRNFESSVPHLYFVGTAAANSFGPLLRFVYGTEFCARRLSRQLAAELGRQSQLVPKTFSGLQTEKTL